MYMSDLPSQNLGGLKKLVRKVGNVVKKIAPIALPVIGGVAGVLAGSALSKVVTKSSNGADLTVDNHKVSYASMSAAQLQNEAARLNAMLANPGTSSKDRTNAQGKLANVQAYLQALAPAPAVISAAVAPPTAAASTNTVDQTVPQVNTQASTAATPAPPPVVNVYTPAAMPANVSEPAPPIANDASVVPTLPEVTVSPATVPLLIGAGLLGLFILMPKKGGSGRSRSRRRTI